MYTRCSVFIKESTLKEGVLSFTKRVEKKKEKVDNETVVEYGDHFAMDGRRKALKPNVQYTSPEGYTYRTDELGRIISCEGTLQKGIAERNEYAQRVVGREDRLSDDDGGHLIATIFKGSGDIDNLVPMNSNLNRGEWKPKTVIINQYIAKIYLNYLVLMKMNEAFL
ncbi:MAG TPA: hypothetical protein DCE02_05430 [Ruminiclostridium sp.]|jgi:predicted ribonuclease toxin of YeeF-YezG toxin-antitoxin module|uniref:Type VII secretion system protein EssD-like domain-containing protein n=1 Tax=Acetivibrio saccincola TaxID=1677857 RepID=A0A2S8R8L0_9FIRM|nr:DNA/RNA non-specific endonuclease [Acetivibrio saccincola]NLW26900.1 hypothetical protein [Acetivibrio saccincola]PQQ66141.1 hypothetical protein B9R14_04775 [Acetivibrio saccincola]HAA43429.1 hypothetical protein [Ruminiclostridium sp.]